MIKIIGMILLLIYQGGLYCNLRHDGSDWDLMVLHLLGTAAIAQTIILALG
jgi:hypothetical protein